MKKWSLMMLCSALLLSACGGGSYQVSQACRHVPAGYYCVQSGDNLLRLSQRFRVSVAELRAWNRLTSDTIHVGDSLIIRPPKTIKNKTQATNKNSFKLQMPIRGKIIQSYTAQNRGIDIAAERGTLVHAAADGVVIYSGNSIPKYGKMLLIRHSNTTITAYANNENLLVPMNAKVKAGQIIAEVGDSGRSDGRTALHFELRVNGKHVNPMAYLQ